VCAALAFHLLRALFLQFPEIPALILEVLMIKAVLADILTVLQCVEVIVFLSYHDVKVEEVLFKGF
jgi:hypothetical protein